MGAQSSPQTTNAHYYYKDKQLLGRNTDRHWTLSHHSFFFIFEINVHRSRAKVQLYHFTYPEFFCVYDDADDVHARGDECRLPKSKKTYMRIVWTSIYMIISNTARQAADINVLWY